MYFLDPKTDITFKKLFGNEHRKNLTISFLNSVLERQEGNLITEISFKDTANLPLTIDKKISFVDINCVDQQKNNYIIEMQMVFQKDFLARSQYYASLVLSRQLQVRGAYYDSLVPVIFVAILNHTLFKNHNNVISHHFITDAKTHEVDLKHLEFHYVELPKFIKTVDELETIADKWFYFLKEADNLEVIPQTLKNKEIQEAFHVLESSQWNQDEFYAYIAQMDELGREERIKAGALQRGYEDGMQQGELKKSQEFVIKLFKKGYAVDEITDLTGLSIDQVEEIKKKMK